MARGPGRQVMVSRLNRVGLWFSSEKILFRPSKVSTPCTPTKMSAPTDSSTKSSVTAKIEVNDTPASTPVSKISTVTDEPSPQVFSFAPRSGSRAIDLTPESVTHKLRAWKDLKSTESLESLDAAQKYVPMYCGLITWTHKYHRVADELIVGVDAWNELREEGGKPSSLSFAAEQKAEDSVYASERSADQTRWAALNPEFRDVSVPIAEQIRKDFAATEALVPSGLGPSSGTRSISRSATLSALGPVVGTTSEPAMPSTPARKGKEKAVAVQSPIILPGPTEISSILHLIPVPQKNGVKEKESAPAFATRANSNILTLASHVLAIKNNVVNGALT